MTSTIAPGIAPDTLKENDGVRACDTAAAPDPTLDTCDVWFGFLPGKTLGIDGKYDNNLLLDPWGMPYQYQVTDVDAGGPTSIGADFVFQGDMKNEGIASLVSDLVVCNTNIILLNI